VFACCSRIIERDGVLPSLVERRPSQPRCAEQPPRPGGAQMASHALQPHPNHRPRRHTSLTERPEHPRGGSGQIEHGALADDAERPAPTPQPSDPEFHHPANHET
jgi:hypothetical protein